MAWKFSNLFRLHNWRAATTLLKAKVAFDGGHYLDALSRWQRAVEFERLRTSDNMVFYAILMALNKRPAAETLAMFHRVAAGEFRCGRDSRYAEALAHYWIAFLTSRSDVTEQWLCAYKLRPARGWLAQRLTLPGNPVDPAGGLPAIDLNR